MGQTQTVPSSADYLSHYNASLVECSHCRSSLNDLVFLNCLHNCCRSCLELHSTGQPALKSPSPVRCPVCCDVTDVGRVKPNVLLSNYKRLSALVSETTLCSTCDAGDVAAAQYWCADCCMGLCHGCYSRHNRFNRRHRSAELHEARSWSISKLTPAVQCSVHTRQMEVQCFTCRDPKCLVCYDSCRAGRHNLQPLSHDKTRIHLSATITAIRQQRERLSRIVSVLQQKSRNATSRLNAARSMDGPAVLRKRRRSLYDSTVKAFDTSVGTICVNLERIWCVCTSVIGRPLALNETVILAARIIDWLSVARLGHLHLLRDGHLLKCIVECCMSTLDASLRRQLKCRQENRSFTISGSAPLTSDIVLGSCLGFTDRRRGAPSAPLLFGQVSRSFRTPFDCTDLAVTQDGCVLLSALQHGLLMYSDRGQQLSRWRPARQSDGEDDVVGCVAALCDGRAAVGLGAAQLVVLLRRSSETGDTWLEDCRFAVLQSPPWRLAVHGDLLAAAEMRRDDQQQQQPSWVPGCHVQLRRLSSGELLYRLRSEYDIGVLALTALCVVTTSKGPVNRNNGLRPHLVAAFSHAGDFLWRYETSDDEAVAGLCAADTWSRVFAVAVRVDGKRRVMAIGGADDRDRTDVLSSRTHGLQYPAFLSLARGQQRTVLAVLSLDSAAEQIRTVTVYEATG